MKNSTRLIERRIANDCGLFNKFLNETTHRPRKFRKRAYHHENDLEDKILDKKLQRPSKDALKDLIYRNCIDFLRG